MNVYEIGWVAKRLARPSVTFSLGTINHEEPLDLPTGCLGVMYVFNSQESALNWYPDGADLCSVKLLEDEESATDTPGEAQSE